MSEQPIEADFAGRVVVITGGSVGIGRALALMIARRGGHAVAVGRDRDRLESLADEARDGGLAIATHRADVAQDTEVAALVEAVHGRFGRLDGMVCAAGSGVMGTVVEVGPAAWDEGVSDRLRAVYLPVHHAARLMQAAGRGSIVAVASVHAHANAEQRDAVAPLTAAMVAFMRGVAVSLGPFGVRANSVSPGPLETPTWRGNWQRKFPQLEFAEIMRRVGRSIPLQRIGQPDDIAEPIAFLLSDRARYITGTDLKIDGGLTAKLAMATQLE